MLTGIILLLVLLFPASAHSGCGWYLFGPPTTTKWVVYPQAPLKHWEQIGAFDTTKECEQARTTLRIQAKEDYERTKDDMH